MRMELLLSNAVFRRLVQNLDSDREDGRGRLRRGWRPSRLVLRSVFRQVKQAAHGDRVRSEEKAAAVGSRNTLHFNKPRRRGLQGHHPALPRHWVELELSLVGG